MRHLSPSLRLSSYFSLCTPPPQASVLISHILITALSPCTASAAACASAPRTLSLALTPHLPELGTAPAPLTLPALCPPAQRGGNLHHVPDRHCQDARAAVHRREAVDAADAEGCRQKRGRPRPLPRRQQPHCGRSAQGGGGGGGGGGGKGWKSKAGNVGAARRQRPALRGRPHTLAPPVTRQRATKFAANGQFQQLYRTKDGRLPFYAAGALLRLTAAETVWGLPRAHRSDDACFHVAPFRRGRRFRGCCRGLCELPF